MTPYQVSRSPELNPSVFSRLRRDRSESPRHRPRDKGKRDIGIFNRLRGKRKSVSAHSKTITKVLASKEQNTFPKNVTMKERIHRGQKGSLKVKIAKGDTGSQNQKGQSEALKRTTVARVVMTFYKKFYNSLCSVPNRCSVV
nr:hypothetical protein [Tanacetum cinerariifolium]